MFFRNILGSGVCAFNLVLSDFLMLFRFVINLKFACFLISTKMFEYCLFALPRGNDDNVDISIDAIQHLRRQPNRQEDGRTDSLSDIDFQNNNKISERKFIDQSYNLVA